MTTYDHAAEARMLREDMARRRRENPPHYVIEGTGARILRYSVHVQVDLMRMGPSIYGGGWLRMTLDGAHRCGARHLAKYLREREAREFREVGKYPANLRRGAVPGRGPIPTKPPKSGA